MNKILGNLIIIAIVLGASIGSTVAYYSDIELSSDNIFVSGELDLRVDSESHYNGKICIDGTWVAPDFEPMQCEADGNIFTKSILEPIEQKCGYVDKCKKYGFDYTIAKWEWNSCKGKYTVEIGPNGTNVWGDARLAYWDSVHPVTGVIRKAAWYYDVLPGGYEGEVTKKYSKYEISGLYFCGSDESKCGNCVKEEGEECDGDDGVPAEYVCGKGCKLIEKEPCEGTWEETDLDDKIHKFFHFSDIRFGDKGEDTISLHVYDNDSWGRLVVDEVADKENTCTEPEYDDEEDCDDDKYGELRKNTKFTFWLDMGEVPGFQNTHRNEDEPFYDKTEGDNIWNKGEPIIFEDKMIDMDGEVIDFRDSLVESYLDDCSNTEVDGDNDHNICHGLAEDGRLVRETVYYFGMSWELPEKKSNEIQSDEFSFDMTLEVEQHRHNNNPF